MIRLSLALVVIAFTAAMVVIGCARLRAEGGVLRYAQFTYGAGRYSIYLDPIRQIRVRGAPLQYVSPFNGRPLSPDGAAYITPRTTDTGVDLFLVALDGSWQRRLTHIDAFPPITHAFRSMRSNTFPLWSPDGEWIAFVSTDFLSQQEIYLIRPDGSDLRRVAAYVSTPTPLQLRWTSVPDAPAHLGEIALVVLVVAGFIFLVSASHGMKRALLPYTMESGVSRWL